MGSSKVSKRKSTASDENGDTTVTENELTYSEKLKFVNKISKPMAGKKLTKKLLKLVKKAGKDKKNNMFFGIKSVQKALRKGEKGLVLMAGDVSPIEIMCHIPGVCEERALPYIYVPSRRDMGSAMGCLRSILLILIKELYDECKEEIKSMPQPVWIDEPADVK
ncbi:hypothetical protein B566_EDAN011193, partial [Ephemera danica]